LFEALAIVDRGDIDFARMRGSWAGAMGQPQFMPSSYARYAVDFDHDGHRDIWSSPPDVFASIANYLKAHGWVPGVRWGREVRVPRAAEARVSASVSGRATGCRAVLDMSGPLSLSTWRRLGVTLVGGKAVPASKQAASLLRLDSRAFLLYGNYEALLGYNCAHTYALSVALLSDRLASR
jgi:membrane-bound lytic murein transglycosylase B